MANKVKNQDYDFCGWATKNDLKCADGLVIRHNAFKEDDGKQVPLVWNHDHTSPSVVLGHAILENRADGVFAYCYFNNTAAGQDAKETVMHGDVKSMSIWANNLAKMGNDVLHGVIREVSLVLAGANPGAFVESVLAHGETIDIDDTEGIIHTGEGIILAHSDDNIQTGKEKEDDKMDGENKDTKKEGGGEKTVQEIYSGMTDEQKGAVAALVAQAAKGNGGSKKELEHSDDDPEKKPKEGEDEKEENEMKHNMFQGPQVGGQVLSHSDMQQIFADAKRIGSLRDAVKENIESGVLAHSIDTTGMTNATGTQTYGFNDPSMLFPDYKSLNNPPEWLSRDMDWVKVVMSGVHHTPFSRIKSVYANITENEARAKGYIKGKQKKTEVFTTLKRTTDPQTIYKLQKMDRDDIIDITDFDVVAWIKAEMRVMLDEEIARAILIGDGRPADAEDKIQEQHVRPIATDVPLFNIVKKVTPTANATEEDVAKLTIKEAIRARKGYKGSGNPTFFTTEDVLTEMLLLEDQIGHRLYKTEAELATAMRVSRIVTVEVMEGQSVKVNNDPTDTKLYPLIGIIVNLGDYNVGADKGGAVDMFDDFDIDFNQYKYLIETRISGALVKPYSAITLIRGDKGVAPTTLFSNDDED